jgi:hypothetical protein
MRIFLDGETADITLENEKTLGEVLAGLEDWLLGMGRHLSGVVIDGKRVAAGAIPGICGKNVEDTDSLNLITSSWTELAAEALCSLRGDAEEYAAADFAGKADFAKQWKESPQGLYLEERFPDLRAAALQTFGGGSPGPGELAALAEERLRELGDPLGEIRALGGVTEEITRRLEDLPLDIQTGKDGRAAETMRLFTGVTEKIFRLLALLQAEGYAGPELTVDGAPAKDFIARFNAAIGDLLAAYESKDIVLVGDMAEYELAPRLRSLYAALDGGYKG